MLLGRVPDGCERQLIQKLVFFFFFQKLVFNKKTIVKSFQWWFSTMGEGALCAPFCISSFLSCFILSWSCITFYFLFEPFWYGEQLMILFSKKKKKQLMILIINQSWKTIWTNLLQILLCIFSKYCYQKYSFFNILNVWAYIEYKWMIFRKIFKSIKKKKIYIRLGIKYKQ